MAQKKNLCLSIDTASDQTSVALSDETGPIAVAELNAIRGQGEALFSMIDQVLSAQNKTPKDLTHIAVAVGPGSFTGVRIGLATARGLGLALKIPVLGINNFQAFVHLAKGTGKIVLDSKREDYFVQDFSDGKLIGSPVLKTTDELKKDLPFTAVGNGAKCLAEAIGCTIFETTTPIAVAIAEIALTQQKETLPPTPLYLREADVTI
ncbi:MAG: tRNA (adenosine(37)-N6)-threonylcarbamoyltransferase complex dimerization subunit type 1 TsaB [Alphaproteobacteria bacterium]|nr:tRNA (adenosine(37)-N6)-threonylcarbamoyltransferase complex dimerization subunit type 1 TsaB [Alphaproteobacteria bacterium]